MVASISPSTKNDWQDREHSQHFHDTVHIVLVWWGLQKRHLRVLASWRKRGGGAWQGPLFQGGLKQQQGGALRWCPARRNFSAWRAGSWTRVWNLWKTLKITGWGWKRLRSPRLCRWGHEPTKYRFVPFTRPYLYPQQCLGNISSKHSEKPTMRSSWGKLLKEEPRDLLIFLIGVDQEVELVSPFRARSGRRKWRSGLQGPPFVGVVREIAPLTLLQDGARRRAPRWLALTSESQDLNLYLEERSCPLGPILCQYWRVRENCFS